MTLAKNMVLIYGCLNHLRLLCEPSRLSAFVAINGRFLPRRLEDAEQHEELVLHLFKIKLNNLS